MILPLFYFLFLMLLYSSLSNTSVVVAPHYGLSPQELITLFLTASANGVLAFFMLFLE